MGWRVLHLELGHVTIIEGMGMRERRMKLLRELSLMDDFLFGVAMENEEFCKGGLALILETVIGSITVNRTQMEARACL